MGADCIHVPYSMHFWGTGSVLLLLSHGLTSHAGSNPTVSPAEPASPTFGGQALICSWQYPQWSMMTLSVYAPDPRHVPLPSLTDFINHCHDTEVEEDDVPTAPSEAIVPLTRIVSDRFFPLGPALGTSIRTPFPIWQPKQILNPETWGRFDEMDFRIALGMDLGPTSEILGLARARARACLPRNGSIG